MEDAISFSASRRARKSAGQEGMISCELTRQNEKKSVDRDKKTMKNTCKFSPGDIQCLDG